MKNEIYLTKDEIKRLIIQSEKLDRLEANGLSIVTGKQIGRAHV